MPNSQIKNFVQSPHCAICGRSVQGWGRARCDTCGAVVCQRHRPLFVRFWQCPSCVQRQQQFLNGMPQSASSSMEGMLTEAERLHKEGRYVEAEAFIEHIAAHITDDTP